jgi:hypothetical protein
MAGVFVAVGGIARRVGYAEFGNENKSQVVQVKSVFFNDDITSDGCETINSNLNRV